MAFILGIFLFALGIAVTIALHEAGHMVSARAFGMRVRRFYVGFGPSVFSLLRDIRGTAWQHCLLAVLRYRGYDRDG